MTHEQEYALRNFGTATQSNDPVQVDYALRAMILAMGDGSWVPDHMLRDRALYLTIRLVLGGRNGNG